MHRQIEEQQRKDLAARQASAAELVAQHYNAVPERGREWRSTESKIKGLRSLNNWIKSTLIQKFSRPEIPVEHMTVLDMACGKGGDLGKWEKAPQRPSLYVGCDIADISIDQARSRYSENMRRSNGRNRRVAPMQAEFYVQDTFGTSLGDIPIVRQVGFDPNAGPGPQVVQGRMFSGGFDVVSMMFALHYSFESEALARGMLRNVSGALKKGGRFIGVMPNSNVITDRVKDLLAKEAPGKTPTNKDTPPKDPEANGDAKDDDEDDWDPEKPSEPQPAAGGGDNDDDWDPEKPSEPQANGNGGDDDEDDWDPEKPSEPIAAPTEPAPSADAAPAADGTPAKDPASSTPASSLPPVEFGNDLYTVRLPRNQPLVSKPLPRDGIFRPPFGWRYHYSLQEAVDAPEFIVPFEAFRALAEEYGLELLYRKGFREVYEDESEDYELGQLAERMGVRSRDRSLPNKGCLVGDEEMEAAAFYHAFCFYKT